MELKDVQALRDMTPEELKEEERKLRQEWFHLRFQSALGRLEKPSQIRAVRRAIARVKTIYREKTGKDSAVD